MNATEDFQPVGEWSDASGLTAYQAAADKALAYRQACVEIRELHAPANGGWCTACVDKHPCRTIQTLDEAGA